MKKYIAIILLLSVASLRVAAQGRGYAPNYNYLSTPKYAPVRASAKVRFDEWVEYPTIHPVPPEHADQPAIYLLRDIGIDYRYEGKGINCFHTSHYIVKVLDESGIEAFSTIKIPVRQSMRVPQIKARTITPGGKVYTIPKEKILTTKDPSGYYTVVIAMEGVEKNAEIELLVKTITPYSFYGHYSFQEPIPIQNARFTLSYPRDMMFEMKSHNGFPELTDTLSYKRKNFEVMLKDIPALKDEPSSFANLHRMSIEYRVKKWAGNNERPRMYTWDDYARKLWDANYNLNEKEKAAVNKFLSEIGVRANGDELENVRKIEKGIKTGITLYELVDYDQRKEVLATRDFRSISTYSSYYDDQKNVLDSIISKKAATGPGYIKLFAACLTQAGVRHQLGTTGDRSDYTLDQNFENWYAMDESLFYFPNLKGFLAPLHQYLRYPVIPAEITGGKGIFTNIPPSGIANGAVYQFRTIPGLTTTETQANLNAAVSFTKDMDARVDVAYAYKGYLSTDLRTRLAFTRPEKVRELVQDMLPYLDKPENLAKYTITNEGFNSYYNNKPLEIYASLSNSSLVDKAGKNYLLKVGQLIGSHEELYTENERKMPVDIAYPSSHNRTITVNIPRGYKVLNPEALVMHEEYVNGDLDPVVSFKSDYSIVKDKTGAEKLIIKIRENYTKLHFGAYDYERYRKVVNAAADFNKVALLIGKRPV
ncbi:MAG: DUF3857 domain-containing protein [Bacteroidota bacterium]